MNVHRNLSVPQLVEQSILRREGKLTSAGALLATTGKFTGRSPRDKFIVQESSVMSRIDWGSVNQGLSAEKFEALYRKALDYAKNRETFVFDGFVGADEAHRLPIRVITEYAWHNLFARQLFIRPDEAELKNFNPEFTVYALPGLKADPGKDGTNSETFIVISFEKKTVLIGGTEYAGEIKKSMFTVMNYLLPLKGVLPMHCSANVGERGDVALFFGLSGTGKTTLSADPNRRLIGDDEHGWSDSGVFNFEGGCYAKCIGLSKEKEPQIWNAIRFGAVLENVVADEASRVADYNDGSLTENTRAAYPVEYIDGSVIPGTAGHPNVILFLTADAFGVLPPIARLTGDQVKSWFLAGYTSKLAGTERGVTEPEATFSACFGAPFLPLSPETYADMLLKKIERHRVRVYLVNTGWTGGPYGVGKRMELSHTRTMVSAAVDGTIENAEFVIDPVFGLACPKQVPGVPSEILMPRGTWPNPADYDLKARELAERFARNAEKYALRK